MARNYSNTAEETALTTGINSSATSIMVGSNTGYPSVPYTIIIDPGLATEEVCEVTNVAGTTWTVERGVDGTPASSHDTGAVVVHGYSARDLRDIQDHVDETTGVHGVTGAIVGTTATQTLSNKTLTSPTINGGTLNSVTLGTGLTLQSPTLVTPTIASFINATHDHTSDAEGGVIETGGGGDGGSGFAGIAYKRTGDLASAAVTSPGESNARPLVFDNLDYNVGGKSFTLNGASNRITLPSDVDDAVWHISAWCEVSVSDPLSDMPFIAIVHQDHGTIASASGENDIVGEQPARLLCASTDFQADSGRWVEVRLGSFTDSPDFIAIVCSVAIHRVA